MIQDNLAIRERRHNHLIALIQSYRLTYEEEQYLESIKNNTEIEIGAKFIKSTHNRVYRFPLLTEQESAAEEEEEFPRGVSFDSTFYDLKGQNSVKNQSRAKIEKKDSNGSRRVKSLGTEKVDERVMSEIRRELRERPKGRDRQRDRVILPSIGKDRNCNSHRIISKSEGKPGKIGQSSSLKTIKNKNYQRMREMVRQEKKEKMGAILGAKLLTEGRELISFGHPKVMINKLRVISPQKHLQSHQARPKKLINE